MTGRELSRLRQRHTKLWYEMLTLGKRIRELEVFEDRPETRVARERAARREMALEILVEVGFTPKADWHEMLKAKNGPAAYAFTKLRVDLLRAIAAAVGVRTDEERLRRRPG